MDDLSLLLLFPPFADPTQPGAGLPSLAAAIQQDSSIEIKLWDLNLDAWEYLLNPKRQEVWLMQAERSLTRLDRRPSLDAKEAARYLALADGVLRGTPAVDHLHKAIDVMRSQAFFSAKDYAPAMNAIEGALALVSAIFHPARLEWGRYWPACRLDSSREIVREIFRLGSNPFLAFSRDIFATRLCQLRPKIVGISVTYLDQIVPALTLAAECKKVLPDTLVVLGGQIVSQWGEDITAGNKLWQYVDAFVLGEGEAPLHDIVTRHIQGITLDGIPNVLLSPKRTGQKSVLRPIPRPKTMANLPCPDYSGLPLERYFSPEPVLTLSASRGCYWGRCAFCAVSPAFRDRFRVRPTGQVIDDLSALMRRHGARLFTFGDDALPRSFVKDLATGISAPPQGAMWQAEARWDALPRPEWAHRLAKAGARNLIFGLESGSDEVLRSMNKGGTVPQAKRVIKACQKAGIGLNLQCFLGFPGETRAQAASTISFLDEVAGPKTTVSCGIFELQKGSTIWRQPQAHGIRLIPSEKESDLPVRYEYQPCFGKTWQESMISHLIKSANSRVPQLCCGINAHTLIYLASGCSTSISRPLPSRVPAEPLNLAEGVTWRVFNWDPDSLRKGRVPKKKTCCLAYALRQGRVMSLGALVTTMLRYADGSTRLGDLLPALTHQERRRLRSALRSMVSQGILTAAD
jgi:anaerobic magnesium-protoporphyrin IX monomethyl ester cyclase